MEIVYIIIGLGVGCAIGYLLAKSKGGAILSERDVLKATVGNLQNQLQMERENAENLLQIERENAENQLQTEREKAESQLQHERSNAAEQLRMQKEYADKMMRDQMALIKEQMSTTSERVLKERTEQLTEKNKEQFAAINDKTREQLAAILDPLQDGIKLMREAVEKSGKEHQETMVRLDATIKHSIEQSREVGERADKLAQALTGENKTQGNFGELRLKQLLEDMGLEEGTQFEEQTTMKDSDGHVIYDEEDGHRMIPDVILHFPDERDVIIDSKMSFKAFEDYHGAQDDVERQEALTRHIASVRQHVNELARKNYSSYIKKGRGRLDFVLMYVFSESALQLALMNDPTLWKEAYDKGVIISGSQNLYMMLRVLEMTWRQVRQIENQEEMMKTANTIIDRVQIFYERVQNIETLFAKTTKAFSELKGITSASGPSIEVAARNLIKFGAKVNPKRKYQLKENNNDAEAISEEG